MEEELNRRKYRTPTGSETERRTRNAVFISTHNTITHELSKSLGSYMIKKWGDIKFDKNIVKLLWKINDHVEKELMKGWKKESHDFITEAVPIDNKERTIDLVDLKNNTGFEFEVNKKIIKKDYIRIDISRG